MVGQRLKMVKKAGLMDRATLLCYESIEFEPSIPNTVLQFDLIRSALKQEMAQSAGTRGFFGNSESPIMVIPNLYLFARGAAEPSYLNQSDENILTDLAHFLGGSPELLVPAWSCLQLPLNRLPADLPARLRAVKLTSPAAGVPSGRGTTVLGHFGGPGGFPNPFATGVRAFGPESRRRRHGHCRWDGSIGRLVEPTSVGWRWGRWRSVPMGFCRAIQPAQSVVREARDRSEAGVEVGHRRDCQAGHSRGAGGERSGGRVIEAIADIFRQAQRPQWWKGRLAAGPRGDDGVC